jgi:hypothetical protein
MNTHFQHFFARPTAAELLRRRLKVEGLMQPFEKVGPLPTHDELLSLADDFFSSSNFKAPPRLRIKAGRQMIDASALRPHGEHTFPVPPTLRRRASASSAPTTGETDSTPHRRAMYAWAVAQQRDQFLQPIYDLFETDRVVFVDRRKELPPEMQPMAEKLAASQAEIVDLVTKTLDEIYAKAAAKFPNWSPGRLYQATIQFFGQIKQLREPISEMQLFSRGFRGLLHPTLGPLVNEFRLQLESHIVLLETGELPSDRVKNPGDIRQKAPGLKLKTGTTIIPVVVDGFTGPGPAVVPIVNGALGEGGGHIAFIPRNLLGVKVKIGPIYMHEDGHLFQANDEGYIEEHLDLIERTMQEKGPSLDLDPAEVETGEKIPGVQWWTQVVQGHFLELNADEIMYLTVGPLAGFLCFTDFVGSVRGKAVLSRKKVPFTLRNYTTYSVKPGPDGKGVFTIEAHPDDNDRVGGFGEAMADEMGYDKSVGQQIADFAKLEAGGDGWITWIPEESEDDGDNSQGLLASKRSRRHPGHNQSTNEDEAPPSQGQQPAKPKLPKIRAKVADYKKVLRLMAAAFLNTELKSLGFLKQRQLLCLTPKMHAELIDPVVEILLQVALENDAAKRKALYAELPKLKAAGARHYPHTIRAAAEIAFHEAIKQGVDPVVADERTEEGGGALLELLRPALEHEMDRLNLRNPHREEELGSVKGVGNNI